MPRWSDSGRPRSRFEFAQNHCGLYSNKHDRFVLREEHIQTLKRLCQEHNRHRILPHRVMSMSDVVNAALDFVFSHQLSFKELPDPANARDIIAREAHRKVFLRAAQHYDEII